MEQQPTMPTTGPGAASDVAARAAEIRKRLRGQVVRQRMETARLAYGQLYTLAEIRRKTAESLPMRLGYTRGASLEPIETYRERIPDAALLQYDEAVRSGLFSQFWVAIPSYRKESQADPWIVAQVEETDLAAIITHWE